MNVYTSQTTLNRGKIITCTDDQQYEIEKLEYQGNSDIYVVRDVKDHKRYIFKHWHRGTQEEHQHELDMMRRMHGCPGFMNDRLSEYRNDGKLLGYVMQKCDYSLNTWYRRGIRVATRRSVLHAMIQVCDGVKQLHNQGFIHFDIKPENLLVIAQDEQIVIADLSSSRSIRGFQYPQTGMTLLPRNPPNRQYDPCSLDCYAIGVMMYEFLEQPLIRGSMEINFPTKIYVDTLAFRRCDTSLQTIITNALLLRYADVNDLRRDIDNYLRSPKPRAQFRLPVLNETHQQWFWSLVIGYASWSLAKAINLQEDDIWLTIMSPILITVLIVITPYIGTVSALLLQSILIAHVNLYFGVTFAIFSIMAALASLWSQTNWQLRMLAILPILGSLSPVLLVVPLALMIKPDGLEPTRQWFDRSISSWPAASVVVLPAALLIGQTLGCGGDPSLCLDVRPFDRTVSASLPWPIPPIVFDDLALANIELFRSYATPTFFVIVVACSLIEMFGYTLSGRAMRVKGAYSPINRVIVAFVAFLLLVIINGVVYVAISGYLYDELINTLFLMRYHIASVFSILMLVSLLFEVKHGDNTDYRSGILCVLPLSALFALSVGPWLFLFA